MAFAQPETGDNWAAFEDRLCTLLASEIELRLTLEANGYDRFGDTNHFVTITRDGDELFADASSNEVTVEPERHLSEADMRRLRELGWAAPDPATYVRYWRLSAGAPGPETCRIIAAATVRVLREVFRVADPADLRAHGWTGEDGGLHVGELGVGAHSLPWRDSGPVPPVGFAAARGESAALIAFIARTVTATRAGAVPGGQLPRDLNRMVRAAGADQFEVTRVLLEQLLPLWPTRHAPLGVWKAWRGTLVRMARESTRARGVLLDLLPTAKGIDGWWLELLVDCGVTDALTGRGDARILPADGRAGWLSRTIGFPRWSGIVEKRRATWPPALWPRPLLELIPRMAAALIADGDPVHPNGGKMSGHGIDLRVMEALVAHGIPIAEVDVRGYLDVTGWVRHAEAEESLAALAAHPVFGPMLIECAEKQEPKWLEGTGKAVPSSRWSPLSGLN
ncbi:hypothetical protein JK358_24340 [Nocardia sp. 2]|uniref:TY-Chap N-terminal domain-containing protein n=1 Tax=Nocardia acididurans TaxID=2802282 RepID=A0ABS1MBD3_9NOCA|nr:hypothetical protein [Nocardia acididurans]MBL1077539.1 hypothetical protein [Nocardia acididurans]